MPTLTVPANSTDTATFTALDEAAEILPAGAARTAIEVLTETLRSGRDVIVAGADELVTPSQAAKILGVSRTHLYKVLDAGALPFSVVGSRDRRIAMSDLRAYVARAEELRRVAARDTARTRSTKALAIDEM